MTDLTDLEVAMIDFERECVLISGPKDLQIRTRFTVSPTTYYRTLSALIARREAYDHDPLTVLRLRRSREQRRKVRIVGHRAPSSR